MQVRWRVLRRESELLDVADLILVSEIYVILPQLHVRMEQEGAFAENTVDEDDQFDEISHFMAQDNTRLHEQVNEYIAERFIVQI